MSSHMFQIESAAIEPKQSRDKSQDNISNECDQISVDPNSSRQSCQIGLARSAALDDKEQPGLATSSIPDRQNKLSLDLLSAQSKYYPKSSPENVNNKLQSTSPIPLSNHNWIRGEIVKNRPTSPYNVSSENSSTLLFGPMSELGTTVSKHNIEQDCSGDLTFPAQVTLDSDKQENNSKNRSVKTKRANSSSVVPYCFSYSLQSNTPIETRSNDSKNSGGKLSLTSKTDNILHSDTSYPNSLKSDSSYSKHNAEAHAKTLGLLPLQKSEDCSFNPSGKNKVREAKPNSKPVRRNSLANSAEYLRKLSLSAKHKTSTSMKKISEFIPFRKTVTISDEFASANQEKYKNGAVSLGNTPTIKRKQGVHIRPLEEELPASLPPSESEKKERRLPEKRVTNGKRNNASQRPKSHLQITDPDYVEYFQKYTSEKDKEFLRKYIHLKQGLESKLAQLELEYMNLLDLEPTEELELNLSTLESTQGDDLIFHCVNLFESHENPEKVLALSMHRDYENYIRSLQNCVFENVFKLINIKTLQNSINDRETEDKSDGNVETEEGKVKKIIPGKRKTQVFESDVFQRSVNRFNRFPWFSNFKVHTGVDLEGDGGKGSNPAPPNWLPLFN